MVNDSTKSMRTGAMFLWSFSYFQHTSDWLFAKVILIRTQPAITFTYLLQYFTSPTQIFRLIRDMRLLLSVRQILSRRQHVPNKQCALNNDVHLITRFYGNMAEALTLSWFCINFNVHVKYPAKEMEPLELWHCIQQRIDGIATPIGTVQKKKHLTGIENTHLCIFMIKMSLDSFHNELAFTYLQNTVKALHLIYYTCTSRSTTHGLGCVSKTFASPCQGVHYLEQLCTHEILYTNGN